MRKLAVFTGAFSLGIFLSQYLLPSGWQLPAALLCAGLMGLGFLKTGHARLRFILIFAGLGLAMAYNWIYTAVVQSPAELLTGTERAQTAMTLCDYAIPAKYGAKVTVELDIPGLHGVKAVYYGDESLLSLKPGNVVTGDVALSSAARIRSNDITSFTSKGIFLLAYSRGEITAERGSEASPRWWPIRVGQAMRDRITQLFDGDTAAFLTAILTGDKSGISTESCTALSEAGILHILAISGMHCAFLLSMVTGLLGRQRRRLTAGLAVPLLLFYMVLAGCSPSVVRSCVMLLFLLAAPLFRRDSDLPTAMGVALFVILVQNPFAAASVSLQLSFASVAGILWLAPKLSKWLLASRKPGRLLRFLAVSLSASLGAMVFTVPLTAYYFNMLSLAAPVSNLLCLTAASGIFSFGLVAVLLGFVSPALGGLLGLVPRLLIRYVLWVAGCLSSLPYHAVYFSNPYLKYWMAYAYLLFGVAYCLKAGTRRRYAVAGTLTAVTLAVTLWAGAARYTAGKLDITVLDVGQGECVALSSGGTFALIDCGSGNSWYSAGEIAADSLQSRGCFRLEYLLLTHYDYDHVSGAAELMARMRVGTLLVPDVKDDSGQRESVLRAAERHGVEVRFVTQMEMLPLGEATITVYPPLGSTGDNEQGLAYLVTAGEYDLLVTGDMSAVTEELLIERYTLPDIEALVVGHHGSKNSSSLAFLDTLTPETAIVSVGSNSYGHPANQTLRRLLAVGAEICRTDLQGDIHITVN